MIEQDKEYTPMELAENKLIKTRKDAKNTMYLYNYALRMIRAGRLDARQVGGESGEITE